MKIKKFSAVIISTLLIIQSIIIGISVIAENSEAKLIAHYTFDDAENLGADSEKSHELAINTSTKVVSSDDNGYSGKAVHIGAYNGYDTHLYTDDILESKTDFTVSAFAKLDIGVVNDNHTIFSNGWQNSGGFSFGFSGCEWMYICADVVGGDWIAFNLKQVTNNSDFSAYDWHNYVLSLEKGTILNV